MSQEGMPAAGVSASFDSTAPAAAAATSATAAPVTPSFVDSLPEEYRQSKWAENFSKSENPFHELAKGYANAESQIGKLSSRLEVPGDNATPEQLQAYRKALGVPDSADAYQYQAPDLSKEDQSVQELWNKNVNADFEKTMRQKAHELGLTPKQFQGMADELNGFNLGSLKSLVAAAAQAETERSAAEVQAFQGVFGDKADAVRTLAKETLSKIGLPKEFANSPDAALIFALDFIHKNVYANDNLGAGGQSSPGVSKAEIRTQIMKLRDEPAYQNKYPVERFNAIHSQLMELYKQEANMS